MNPDATKRNPFRTAGLALVVLYIVAIVITYLRKHEIDADLIFWAAMSILLLSGFDYVSHKK